MRKPRDYDAELKALEEKARNLRVRKINQQGELVAATGADALDVNLLAGGLIALAQLTDGKRKEELRKTGAAFFRGRTRKAAGEAGRYNGGDTTRDGAAASAEREAGAA